ncbi:hypothetical protein PF010_g15965 [Phytophthora fragariae]|uniref:DUF7869 domain-containing protein n=1 Tax=Phytophthora fragariae TaxID=53985 RepID=A0A6G0KSF0_9STRA|nr:hypothetical protein PF010_g15965 [Phytophthora fragariae]
MDSLSDEHAVIIIDYSQNLTLPSVANTPSQWYFMSLWAVNVFGIYYANRSTQYNFVYGEDVAGKGSEEVISMLRYFLRKVAGLQDPKRLTIYTDNCTGQNKNNFVAKYLLALVHTATLERVDLKFFVKGHTKNAVDRGFGHVRKKFARTDVWTMDQLVRLVDEAATSSATVPINADSDVFKSFKGTLTEAYRDIPGPSLLDAKGAPGHGALPRRPRRRARGVRPPPRLRRHQGGRPAGRAAVQGGPDRYAAAEAEHGEDCANAREGASERARRVPERCPVRAADREPSARGEDDQAGKDRQT